MAMLQGDNRVSITSVNGHYEGRIDGQFVVSGDTWNEVYNDLNEMEKCKMSQKRWFDCNGQEIHEGDKVRNIFSDKVETVYACHPDGHPYELNLGLNASNERFLELHPTYRREVYPFDNFEHYLIKGQLRLAEYEKVVSK